MWGCPEGGQCSSLVLGGVQTPPNKKIAIIGHKDVKTTMIYTHVLNRGGQGVRSPADML